MTNGLRLVRNLVTASRCDPKPMPKASNVYQANGLRYEKKVNKALAAIATKLGATVEFQPWFKFEDMYGIAHAVPDLIFTIGDRSLIVEVKSRYTPDAEAKLRGLYMPVVQATTITRVYAVVICRTLTPGCMSSITRLSTALESELHIGTLQWLGHGAISW